MENALTYEDFLQRVNIQDLLQDAGYQHYRRDGLKYPSYIRIGSDGRKVSGDKFLVNAGGWGCFQPPEQKVYNVISFIKEHPDFFQDYNPGMDKGRLVHLVCNRILNHPMPDREERIVIPNKNTKPFRLSDYEIARYDPRHPFSQKVFDGYFKPRGISHETQAVFKDHFFAATKKLENGLAYANLSFPLSIPGKEGIVGLEVRGKLRKDGTSFKGKAEGSNGTEGLWIANLSGKPLDKVQHILWFESAYDAMCQFQLEGNEQTRQSCAYVSTGGNPTIMQIRGMLEAAPNARHYVGFDKDLAGKQFLANFRSIADNMGYPKDHVIANHPLGYYKDWNDALLGKKTMTLTDVACDYDYNTKQDQMPEEEQDRQPSFHR